MTMSATLPSTAQPSPSPAVRKVQALKCLDVSEGARDVAAKVISGLRKRLSGMSSKPASNKVLEKALMAELEGLQKIHVAVVKQITRLQSEEAVLKELIEKALAESAQPQQPAYSGAVARCSTDQPSAQTP